MYGYAFDMDGTLIDSMAVWSNLKTEMCNRYYKRTGQKITLSEDDGNQLEFLSLKGAAKYLNKKYNLKIDYKKDAFSVLEEHYLSDCTLHPYTKELLTAIKKTGAKICVITATPKELAKKVLTRLGIIEYFDFIVTPELFKGGKHRTPIFYYTAFKMRKKPKNICLIDDAAYAHTGAKKAGFRRIGIYDKYRDNNLSELTDIFFLTHEEMYNHFVKRGDFL